MARRWVDAVRDDEGNVLEEGYYYEDGESESPVTGVVPPDTSNPVVIPEPEETPGQLITPGQIDNPPEAGQGWTQDEFGNWYKLDSSGNLTFKDAKGTDYTYDPKKGGFVDSKGNLAGETGGIAGLIQRGGQKLLDAFKDKNGNVDFGKLLTMAGGAYAASRPNNAAAPTGYQGKIPKLTASRNMLTAPPVGRRPGSGGIDYGGGVTYRDEAGKVISSNERTLEELRQAAINNPFNRGATYEGQTGLGQSDLITLLNSFNPPKTPTAPTTPAPTAPAAPVVGSGTAPSTGGGITAIAPRPTTTATSGATVALRQQLRDEYAKGPKTQDALDNLLLKYPPAAMQAEFPQFGGVADYNNATREAYQRQEQKARERNREAMRSSGQEISVANPGGGVAISSPSAPVMSAIPQAELAAARAKLTPEQAAFIDWKLAQVNSMTGQRVADDFARQGTNPYSAAGAAQAQEQIDRGVRRTDLLSQAGASTANIAPWTDPNWQATQQAKEDAERARADKQRQDWYNTPEAQRTVAGPGGPTAPTSGYGNYLDKPIYTPPSTTGAIKEWYETNAGKGTQADLDNWLANSGYTAKEIATALPQWGESDLQTAINAAKGSSAPATAAQAPAPAPAPVAAPSPAAAPTDNWMSNLSSNASAAPQGFDWQKYTAINTDLGAAGIDTPEEALRHYQYYGQQEGRNLGLAKGGLARDGFVVPADVVSHFGNGSSEAGLKLLASKIGATPIKGDGDGMSDSIPTKIDGVQEARVANDEAYVSPEMVAKLGNGSPEKGARKLYAMMDKIRKARTGSTEQGKEIDPNKYMPGGSVQRYAVGGTTVPTGATGSESSLSNWGGDYVTNMLGQGAALANAPYQAYTGPLTAGASGLQQQAFGMAGNLQTPGSIGQAAGTAGGIANLAANMRYTPQTTDFLGGANMSGLGVAPSYGMGMPQQQAPANIQTRPAPMPYGESGPTTFSTKPLRIKQEPQQAPDFIDFNDYFNGTSPGGGNQSPSPTITRDPGYVPKDPNYGRGVDAEGREFFRLPETDFDFGPSPMQKPRPTPSDGGMLQTKPMREYGGSQYNPVTGAESRDLRPLQPGDPRLQDGINYMGGSRDFDESAPFMQEGAMTGGVMRPPGQDVGMIQDKMYRGESPDRFAVDGGMTGGVMRPPGQETGLPSLMQARQPQPSQPVGNIAQQYMNPYLESALRPQMAEMQRSADIARMSDAARLAQAGAFGGSRQAIMESEGRRNLLGKQSDVLAQGYSTAYDKAMQQFNADQARRAQEAQFGATYGLEGARTGIQGAQVQGQLGAQQSQADLANLRGALEAGGVERGIESEGIAADKAQFEEARLNPYKMLQFQQSLLSGLPLAAQSYSIPGQSNFQQFAGGAKTIQELLDILSGKTTATTKP